jgi:long-chain fatty acid transport protein
VKQLLGIVCACSVSAAFAGGLDHSGQPVGLLFHEGNHAELAIGVWRPEIRGADFLGFSSGNVYGPVTDSLAGTKRDFGPRWSGALIVDQPYGGALDYPDGPFAYAGTSANPQSLALTALARWRAGTRLAFHGGVRVERIAAAVTLDGPAYGPLAGYRWEGAEDWGVGWVAGASWEKPEIGLRVALTYGSEIRHELDSSESFPGAPGPLDSSMATTMPQSVNLDLQTGLGARTLLYGSLRWVDWNGWSVAPEALDAVAGPLVQYQSDAWTWRIGVGRQLTETVSAAVELAHETPVDMVLTPLSPFDGFTALSVGSRYRHRTGVTLSGSVGYTWLGDSEVTTPGLPEPVAFEGSHAVSAQLRIGMDF